MRRKATPSRPAKGGDGGTDGGTEGGTEGGTDGGTRCGGAPSLSMRSRLAADSITIGDGEIGRSMWGEGNASPLTPSALVEVVAAMLVACGCAL